MSINRLGWFYRFAVSSALLNLVWEILQLPLYTVWVDASARTIAYAVLHCTAGDVLIACLSLLCAIVLVHPGDWTRRPGLAVWTLTLVFGWGYTVYSEWYNTTVTHAWSYGSLMPQIGGIGLAPLVQWLVIPNAAFWWGCRSVSSTTH